MDERLAGSVERETVAVPPPSRRETGVLGPVRLGMKEGCSGENVLGREW